MFHEADPQRSPHVMILWHATINHYHRNHREQPFFELLKETTFAIFACPASKEQMASYFGSCPEYPWHFIEKALDKAVRKLYPTAKVFLAGSHQDGTAIHRISDYDVWVDTPEKLSKAQRTGLYEHILRTLGNEFDIRPRDNGIGRKALKFYIGEKGSCYDWINLDSWQFKVASVGSVLSGSPIPEEFVYPFYGWISFHSSCLAADGVTYSQGCCLSQDDEGRWLRWSWPSIIYPKCFEERSTKTCRRTSCAEPGSSLCNLGHEGFLLATRAAHSRVLPESLCKEGSIRPRRAQIQLRSVPRNGGVSCHWYSIFLLGVKCAQAAVKYFFNDMNMSTQQTAGDTVQGGLGMLTFLCNYPVPPKGISAMLPAECKNAKHKQLLTQPLERTPRRANKKVTSRSDFYRSLAVND